MSRQLPVLNFESFRRYPTRLAKQEFADERQVCHECVSGACCTSEDPIYLTSFDVFRLAAFLDMTPAEFLLGFTQDRFDGEDSNLTRRPWIDSPESSKVTYLRRRESHPTSPCIFLKYIHAADGTPRRICSVHEGRPLSCREFYFDTCKNRQTGELAALLAEGFEKVRDGEITDETVERELERFSSRDPATMTIGEHLEYNFWTEMRRVVHIEAANFEGANSYDIARYQDPIDEKLNRVLSAKYLRFEEKYGAEPHGEQLMPYTAGRSFAASPERERIMHLICTPPPAARLFNAGEYPYLIGVRTLVPGVRHADVFQIIPDEEIDRFLAGLPVISLFPEHHKTEVRAVTLSDIYRAVLRSYNHLIHFTSRLVALGNPLELEPPGRFEVDLLTMLTNFETSSNPYLAHNPYLQPVKRYLAEFAVALLEESLAYTSRPADDFALLRLLCIVKRIASQLAPELQMRLDAVGRLLDARLAKDRIELYVDTENPIAARRMSGKRLDGKAAQTAWHAWSEQIADMRYAATAGFARVDLPGFYTQVVGELSQLPYRRSYALHLCRTATTLARSMSDDARIDTRETDYKDAAARLAAFAVSLLERVRSDDQLAPERELVADFAAAIYRGLNLSFTHDEQYPLIVRSLIASQLPDGSWDTNPLPFHAPESQADYLYRMYRTTWACVDALRPVRHDAQHFQAKSVQP